MVIQVSHKLKQREHAVQSEYTKEQLFSAKCKYKTFKKNFWGFGFERALAERWVLVSARSTEESLKFDDVDEIAQIIKLNFLFWSNAVVCVTAFDHCSWAIFSWRCTTSLLCLREDGGITLMCTEQAIFFVDWYTVNVMLWTVFVRKWPATGSLDSTLPMVYAKQKWFT